MKLKFGFTLHMDAQFALSSLFLIALVAQLFRFRTSRYHKLVDTVVCVAVVVRIAAVVRIAVVVARLIAVVVRFFLLRGYFFHC